MYLEHVFRALGLRAIDGEGVVCVVDGAPVGEGGFEGRFDFPVLDEILHEVGEGAGFVVLLLCWLNLGRRKWLCEMALNLLSANIFLVLE
jgi:hypothetical protein